MDGTTAAVEAVRILDLDDSFYLEAVSALVEAGQYDQVIGEVGRFPTPPRELTTKVLLAVSLDRAAPVDLRAVCRALERQSRRPALLAELLAFGEQYPQEQRSQCVVTFAFEGDELFVAMLGSRPGWLGWMRAAWRRRVLEVSVQGSSMLSLPAADTCILVVDRP